MKVTPIRRRTSRQKDVAGFESRLSVVEKDCYAFDKWCKDTNGDIHDLKNDVRDFRKEVNDRTLDLRRDFNLLRVEMTGYFDAARRLSLMFWVAIIILVMTVFLDIFRNYV